MPVYIVREQNKFKIITVQVHQEAFFLIDYAGMILVSAGSIPEALIKFGELPDELKQAKEESSQ